MPILECSDIFLVTFNGIVVATKSVPKAILSLIASINKQIAALQKALLKKK